MLHVAPLTIRDTTGSTSSAHCLHMADPKQHSLARIIRAHLSNKYRGQASAVIQELVYVLWLFNTPIYCSRSNQSRAVPENEELMSTTRQDILPFDQNHPQWLRATVWAAVWASTTMPEPAPPSFRRCAACSADLSCDTAKRRCSRCKKVKISQQARTLPAEYTYKALTATPGIFL